MTQVNASMTFDTRRMEESITAAVLAGLGQTVAEIVLPGIAQVASDLQRLTKLLESEAVGPDEFASVLAHSGAIGIEVAQAQAASLTRLGYRLMPVPASTAPEPVAATWAGPTPPQGAPETITVVTGTGETSERPLWTPPAESPAAQLGRDLDAIVDQTRIDHPRPGDKDWLNGFE